MPPLTDEAFELFVEFFWLIKVANRPKADLLLSDIRRQWGLEIWFYPSIIEEFLASEDATAFVASYWPGQNSGFTGKSVSKLSAL